MLEFIRVDETPYFLGLRFPQIISLLIIILFSLIIIFQSNAAKEKNSISRDIIVFGQPETYQKAGDNS